MTHELSTEIMCGVWLRHAEFPETINLDLHNPQTWERILENATKADAGIYVDENKALTYAPVWQAVTLISSAVACLPFNHYRRLPDGGSERIDSIQDYLVSVTPSGGVEPDLYEPAVQFWENFMVDALLWNNAYAYIDYDGAGRVKRLILLNPDRTNFEWIGGNPWYVTEYDNGQLKNLYPWEVLHVRGLCPTGKQAPKFIEYARNSIGLGLAQQKFTSKFFANGARVGGILELPAGMPKPARDTVEEGFKKSYTNDNPFATVVLRESAKFHQAQNSPTDAQMVEASQDQVRMIARWFNIAPSLLGVPGGVVYKSDQEAKQNLYDFTIRRWLTKIASECRLKLITPSRQAVEYFKHDVTELTAMDPLQQAQVDEIYIRSRVVNPNQVRMRMGWLPYDGGDEFSNPNTSSPMAQQQEPDQQDQQDQPPDAESQDAPDMQKNEALPVSEKRALVAMCLNARHKAKKPNAFVEFVDKMDRSTDWQIALASVFTTAIETATPDALVSEVERICGQYEQIYLGG